MLIDHTTGKGIDKRYYGMAKISAGQPVTATELSPLILEHLEATTSKAQQDAMATARESGKSPRAKRSTKGKTCQWCVGLSTKGEWVSDPDPELFMRHAGCDCKIYTAGYNSRNGLLDNYVKKKQ